MIADLDSRQVSGFLETLGLAEEPPGMFIPIGSRRRVFSPARKFLKADELTFTVPWEMFRRLAERWPQSFLTTKTWSLVRKKIARSKRVGGEP